MLSSVTLPPLSVTLFVTRAVKPNPLQQTYAEKLQRFQNRTTYILHVSEYENCAKLTLESMAIVLVI